MSRICLFLLVYLMRHSAMSQSSVVNDSCTGNMTIYSRINDSLYSVKSLFRHQPIFNGFLFFPKLDELYNPESSNQYDDYNNKTTQTGRCTTWLNNGVISSISYYQPLKKEIEKWTFTQGKIETHTLFKPSYYLSEQFDSSGKLRYSNIDDYRDGYGKRTIHQPINGKLKKFYFVEDRSNGAFYPRNGVTKSYNINGELLQELYYFKNTSRIQKTIYYDENNINIYESDMEGNEIRAETKDKKTGKTTYLRKSIYLKDASGFVYDHIKWEEDDTKDTSFIAKRSLKDSSIYAFRYQTDYYIWFKNGLFNANIHHRDSLNPFDRVEYRQKGKHLIVKAWKKGQHRITRHIAYPDFYTSLQFFPNPIKELNDQLYFFDYTFSDYTYKFLVNEPSARESDETHYRCLFADSFYTNGILTCIHTFTDDTIIYYNIINGRPQIAYHSHYLKPIKDINQCATGMKNLQGEWTIPARYDEIRPIFSDTALMYFCLAGDYTTVYSWDGVLILPPTKHIVTPLKYDGGYQYIWRLSKKLTDSLKLSNNCIIQMIDEDNKQHQFINLKSELLIGLPYRIFAMSGFKDEGLDNMSFNISDSLGRIGYIDLKGQYFPCKYALIDYLENGDRLMRLDSSKDIFIVTPQHQVLDIPPFADYRRMEDNDSLLMLIGHDSSLSIYHIYNRYAPKEYHYFKLLSTEERNGLFNAFYKDNLGVVNRFLQTVIPFKYTHIFITAQDYYMCRNADTTDFYTPYGQFANRIICDSIYHHYNLNYNFSGYPYQVSDYYNRGWGANTTYLIYSKNGQFGLINGQGKLLSNRLFDKIARTSITHFLVFFHSSQILTGQLASDTILIRNQFPLQSFLYFENLVNAQDNGIINYKGDIIVTEITSENSPMTRYANTSIFKADKLYGIINIMGEWVLKSDRYQQCLIRPKDGLVYVTDTKGRAGMIDCSGKEIVKFEHNIISYEPKYHILWYTDHFNQSNLIYNEETHNIWQISNGLKTLIDTLDYPTDFINGYTIVKNRRNVFGIIDSALNVPYGFRFTSYNSIMNSHCILKDSSGQSWLMDKHFRRLKTFQSNKISLLNDTMLMVFNGNMSYTMTISGQVLDSSMNFFAEFPKSTFSTYWNDEDNIEERLSDNEEEYYEELEKKEVEDAEGASMRDTCSDAQINFIKIVNLYMDASESNIYYGNEIFPTPNYQYRDNYYYDYPYELIPGIFTYNIVGFGTLAAYEASRFSLSQLDRFTNLYIDGHSGRLLNYTYNMGRDYNNDLWVNFYFSDNNIIYEFILSDLIEPTKHAEFNQLVIKTLERLELQDIPCYKSRDFIELLNDKMKAGKDGIELKVESDISITLSYEDLKPMMREVWREKLLD